MPETQETTPVVRPGRIDHERDAQRTYLIAPENRDLFVRTGRQVIAACNTQLRIERWLGLDEEMLLSVRDFAEDHGARTRKRSLRTFANGFTIDH